MKTVLGLDLGTQSLKAVFYNYDSKHMEWVSTAALELERDANGGAEQHADWWLAALKECIAEVPLAIRESVEAISVSGQQHGFVALDNTGKVLAPVKLWCDTSTQTEVDQITQHCGGREAAIDMTGNPVVCGFTAPKILWLKNHHPSLYAQLAHILLPHDYLNYILTGEFTMEYGDASGTGLLDVRTRQWSVAMLKAVDSERELANCLPPLVTAEQFIGKTTQAFAEAYGLPEGIPVTSGGGDNMMGAIGTGNVCAGKLTMSLGSSGTLYAYSSTPVVDPEGNIAAFCSSTGAWLPLLCTMNCTQATDLMCQSLGFSLEQMDAVIKDVDAGSDGLIALPFFFGERTPDLPHGKGCFLGLTADNCSKGHMLRATIEAVMFGLKFGLDTLTRLGVTGTEIVLTGGGANSSQWRQMVADIFQLPVSVLVHQEGASFGAALQALWLLQKRSDAALSIESITAQHVIFDQQRCVLPQPCNAQAYILAYALYQKMLKQITPLYRH